MWVDGMWNKEICKGNGAGAKHKNWTTCSLDKIIMYMEERLIGGIRYHCKISVVAAPHNFLISDASRVNFINWKKSNYYNSFAF